MSQKKDSVNSGEVLEEQTNIKKQTKTLHKHDICVRMWSYSPLREERSGGIVLRPSSIIPAIGINDVTAHICFIGSLHTPDKREFTTLTTHALKCDTANMHKFIVSFPYVGGSSKIQTLCHMTQVLLKLRFTMDSDY